MHIAFFELEGWEKSLIKGRLGRAHKLTFIDGPLQDAHLPQVRDAEVLEMLQDVLSVLQGVLSVGNLVALVCAATSIRVVDLQVV